ncbi:type IV secretion system protein [Pseudonocardia sp. ICBG162]|uniref:type IV secretion system protein n=1 Tax=Pseudonocardia sp. ICBG162 TaxID=2846761 RepID=UPI001CF69D8C|nr:type IV secretion system protein [Pseudonocardia sp. ICBG162]
MTSILLIRYPTPVPPPLPEPSPGGGSSGKGDSGSGFLGSIVQSGFDAAMQKVWDAGVWVLRAGFELADQVSWVDPSTITGQAGQRPTPPNPATAGDAPGAATGAGAGAADAAAAAGEQSLSLWSSLVALATLIALGLFFYQLISVALRGGRGMFRAFTGPLQFGMAIALTSGMVAVLLGAADGMATFFLSQLGGDPTFGAVLAHDTVAARVGDNPDLANTEDNVRSMILGLAALFGVIPAGIGFALQMIFRQAAILVLVATIPLLAAMLVTDSTAPSFWRGVRWLLAAILMKPALALVLLIGVSVMSRATGVAGLLAGTAVLLVSLFCPMVLYRLLAFVDPGTGAGMALRAGGGDSRGSSAPGADGGTSESINVARMARSGSGGGGGGPSAGGGGELGGSTAASPTGGSTAAAGRAGGAGAAGGGSAAGGAAAGLGAAGGVAAAAVVGGYMATKAAAGAAGGYGSAQMAQTGVGHPGAAPAGGGGADVGAATRGAHAGTTATSGWSGTPPDDPHPGDGPDNGGPDNGPLDPTPGPGPDPGPGPGPGPVAAQPPDTGHPAPGPDTGPPTQPGPAPRTPEALPVDTSTNTGTNTGTDGPTTTPNRPAAAHRSEPEDHR